MAIEEFDDMFVYVGGFGKFQKVLLLVSFPFYMLFPFIFYSQIFYAQTPDHWCHVPQLENLPLESRMNISLPREMRDGKLQHSRCFMYDVNFTQVLRGDAVPNETWPIVKCQHGWEYDTVNYYSTVVSELNWVCDEDWRPSAAQTLCFAGSIFGTLIFGWIADRWGRLPALIASNLLACVAGIATAFAYDFTSFMVCRFLSGLPQGTFFVLMYIILQEYVSADKRSLVGNLPIAIFLTVGLVILPWIAYAIWDWRYLAIALSAPFAIVLLAPWLVPESGLWLLSNGKAEKTEEILRRVATVNGKKVPEEIFVEFRTAARKIQEQRGDTYSYLDLFRTPILRNRVIVMIIVWSTASVCYDGHMRNLANLPYSLYVSFAIAGLLELPADLLTIIALDWLGRRWTMALSMIFSGAVYLGAAFPDPEDTLSIASLAMSGRFFITMSINAFTQYTLELLPTMLRAQGNSLLYVAAFIASMFSPYVVYLGIHNILLPFIILGVTAIIGGLFTLLLPETAEEPLPNTITEAEDFGRNQSLWFLPGLNKKQTANGVVLKAIPETSADEKLLSPVDKPNEHQEIQQMQLEENNTLLSPGS